MINNNIRSKYSVMRLKITFCFTLLSVVLTAQTVNIEGDPYGGNPYVSITAAIAAATNGDVILISGIHTESIGISKSVTIKGTDPTTDIIQAAATAVSDGTGSRVIGMSGGNLTITIENLGIRHGNNSANGAGINVDKVTGLVTLNNLIVENNYSTSNGAGMSFAGSNVDVIQCTIRNNTTTADGGGIIAAPNNAAGINCIINITQSLINGNSGNNGGGIYVNGNSGFGNNHTIDMNIENSTISNNTATSASGAAGGGGIWCKVAEWLNDPAATNGGNINLNLLHATTYNNSHAAAAKNGIQCTGTTGFTTNFSAYNSIIVNADTVSQRALNFANVNTIEVINCILGGLNAAPTAFLDTPAKNNVRGKTATFAGLTGTLTDEGGNTQVLAIGKGSNSDDYCTASTGISIPVTDQRDFTREGTNDAGAYEYYDNSWQGTSDTDWATVGNWTNGLPGASDDIIIPNVANKPIIGSSTAAEINNIQVTGSSLTIQPGGSLIVNGTSSGNVTYNRALTFVSGNSNGWYLMGSPVAGVTFNDTFVTNNDIAFGTGSNRGVATYITSSDSWSYLQSGGSIASTAGIGYSVKRGTTTGTVAFTGTINTSDVTPSISNAGNGFNLMGNPYTSYVNSATFLTDNTGNLESETIWLWNQGTGNYETKVTASAYTLSPGQGFFVKASSGSTVNFAESNQSSGTDVFQRNTTSRLEIHLLMTDGVSERFAEVYYIDGTTTGFDNGYDGETFSGQQNSIDVYTHLVSDSQGRNYQIQSLPNSNYENMIIPVGVTSDAGSVTFSLETLNLPAGYKVFLEDRDTGNFIRLDEAGSSYDANFASAVSGIGRFYLHTTAQVLSIGDLNFNNISIYPTADNSILNIVGLDDGKASLTLFDLTGKRILDSTFQSNRVNIVQLPEMSSGIYIVKIKSENGSLNKKILIN